MGRTCECLRFVSRMNALATFEEDILHTRYAGVILFDFHVIQLLPIRSFTTILVLHIIKLDYEENATQKNKLLNMDIATNSEAVNSRITHNRCIGQP